MLHAERFLRSLSLCRLFAVVSLFTLGLPVNLAHADEPPETLAIGAEAPDFDLLGVDGQRYSLSSFQDAELLAFVFTANHCPTAQAYEDRISQLHEDYRDRGVAVVAVSPNDPLAVRLDELGYSDLSDSYEEMQLRMEERGFTFPYLYDGDTQAMSQAYGPVATPHVFIFDRARKLRYVGRIDDNENPARVTSHDTRDALEALLAGRPVPVETTKTFGCSVKWADKRSTVADAFARWAQEPVRLQTIDVAGIEALMRNDTENLRLINLWATWCGPCVVEFPELVSINRMYRGRDFELVTISADQPEAREDALEFLQEQQASSTNYIFDSDDRYALIEAVDEAWPGSLPYTVLIAPGGEVLYRAVGLIDPLETKRAIVEHLGRYYF